VNAVSAGIIKSPNTIIESRPPHCPAQLLLSPDPRWSSIPAPAVQPAVEDAEAEAIEATFHKAYRWHIHSGAQHPQFGNVLSSLITENQGQRIQAALATLQ
jgi:hypothetical protein